MSRYSSSGSHSHRCQDLGHGDFRLSWMVDRYYSGSRLRHPRWCTRDTDATGARRFCKKWKIELPTSLAAVEKEIQ